MKKTINQIKPPESAAAYIDRLVGRRVKNGLDNIRRLLPPETDGTGAAIIHVTGTNGKGSICAFLASVYRAAGYRVGVFSSPHLVEVRERFRINGEMMAEADFEDLVARLRIRCEAIEQTAQTRFGFFEFLLAVAMTWFHEQAVDIILLEVGIGGRFDATNYIRRPAAAVIGTISLDHENILGTTVAEVAGQKAGIVKAGAPVIYLSTSAEADEIIRAEAKRLSAPGHCVLPPTEADIRLDGHSLRCRVGRRELRLPTIARYQAANAAVALRTISVLQERLPVDEEQLINGIAAFSWPGRMEEVHDGIYVDGSHNPEGVRALIDSVRYLNGKKILLFGVVNDKKYDTMIQELTVGDLFSEIHLVTLRTARKTQTEILAEIFRRYSTVPVYRYASVSEALEKLLGSHRFGESAELLICAGSLYLVGEIKEYIDDKF
ncbi:MAG: Mur ligase family protein [Lachnospiraceae bacterium]|nr:Mur ligase family protein [Lachnospiraceae bacterium]MDY5742429.1 Mur ligase family protein [Lachnospiraceae bacterium]